MKLFTTGQIRRWDEATILEERIQSVDLMERAAKACAESILGLNPGKVPVHIFCGPGNNGGDGLAITRLLQGYDFSGSWLFIGPVCRTITRLPNQS